MNFQSFDLNLLRVFDAVLSEGSITRAAQRLSLTQPAVSHALKRLREATGEDWLQRTAHGMRPTARAEAVWPQVRVALQTLEQAVVPPVFDPRTANANFRVAMADSTAALLMPPLVAAIERERAFVNLRVLPLATRDPSRLIDKDEVDVAVGYFPTVMTTLLAQGEDAGLRHERLYTTDYVCVMRRDHPLASAPLTLDGFCGAHHLLVSFSGRPYGFVDEALAALGRKRRIVLTVNQFFTAGRVVVGSDLLTVLPASFVPAAGYHDQLVKRPLPLALARVHVDMVWHARRDRDPAHRWLRDHLVQAVRDSAPLDAAAALDENRTARPAGE